eukprot:gene5256-8866_t
MKRKPTTPKKVENPKSYQTLVDLYPQITPIERTSYIRVEKSKNIKSSKETIFFVYDIHTEKEEHHKMIENNFLKVIELKDDSILKHEDLFIKIKNDQLIRSYYLTTKASTYTPYQTLESYFYETKLKQQKIPAEMISKWFNQILHALSILADHNITHSNIQLSSVLIDKKSNVKLSKFGFGFENVIDLLTENEEYIAPEVYTDDKFTHLSDVYALGILMLKLMGVTDIDEIDDLKSIIEDEYKGVYELSYILDCIDESVTNRPTANDLKDKLTITDDDSDSESFSDYYGRDISKSSEPESFDFSYQKEVEPKEEMENLNSGFSFKSKGLVNTIEQKEEEEMEDQSDYSSSSSTTEYHSRKKKDQKSQDLQQLQQQQIQQLQQEKSSEIFSNLSRSSSVETKDVDDFPDKLKISQVALDVDSNIFIPKSPSSDQKSKEKGKIQPKKKQTRGTGLFRRQRSSEKMEEKKIVKPEISLPLISTEFMKSQIKESNQKELLISCAFDYLCFSVSRKFINNQEIFKEWKEFLFDLKPIIENKLSKEIQSQYQKFTTIFQSNDKDEIVEKLKSFSKSTKIEKKSKNIFGFNLFKSLNTSTFFRKLTLKDSEKEEIISEKGNEKKKSYKVEKTIGFGCSANIYLVSDIKTSEKYAMKVFKEGSEKDAENEISLYKKLNSNNYIVSYKDSFKFDDGSGTICYALIVEYCNEGDLSKKKFKKMKLTKTQILAIMKQTIQGIIHVHSLQYVHCDLKPANIFKSDGVTKVADFGFTTQNQHPMMGGTIEYMSHEQFENQTMADYFIDIWSIEKSTGKTNFKGIINFFDLY